MAITAEDVASNALGLLGVDGITDLDDTGYAGVTRGSYDGVILDLLARHNWRFSRAFAQLSPDAVGVPPTRWAYAYLFPTDIIGMPVEVFNRAESDAMPHSQFELSGSHVLTNETLCIVGYTARKDERYWHPSFTLLAEYALAAKWAMPVTEVTTKADFYRQMAFGNPSDDGRGGQFRQAVNADVRNEPMGTVYDTGNPLRQARFGGWGRV